MAILHMHRSERREARRAQRAAVNAALVAADQANPGRLDREDKLADWTPDMLDRLAAEVFGVDGP